MWFRNLFYKALQVFFTGMAVLMFRFRYWGGSAVPKHGGLVIAANHQSFLDPPLIGLGPNRIFCYLARDTLFEHRLLGAFIRFVNTFPVKLGAGDIGAFKQSLRLLRAGHALLLFPEGTRTSTGGIGPIQPGAVAMARKAGVPIVPAAIEGAFEIWPRSAHFPKIRRLWIEYGSPIPPSAFEGLGSAEAAALFSDVLRQLHNRLRERAGRPPIQYAADHEQDSNRIAAETIPLPHRRRMTRCSTIK